MENFSTHNSFENYFLWAKANCRYPLPYDCASTCTSISHSSHISPTFLNMEREDDDNQSHFSHFHPNSPANSEDLEDSVPDGSLYANDGSFDERLQDTFTDLLQNYDETGIQCEEDCDQQIEDIEDLEQKCFNTNNRAWEKKKLSESKQSKLLYEAWKMIRKLFLKYLGTPEATEIIKHQMQMEKALWEIGIKDIYRALRRQAKKISRGDIVSSLCGNLSNDDYLAVTNVLFQRLFIDFMHEKAAYAVGGMNITKSLKRTMLDVLATTGRALNIPRG